MFVLKLSVVLSSVKQHNLFYLCSYKTVEPLYWAIAECPYYGVRDYINSGFS